MNKTGQLAGGLVLFGFIVFFLVCPRIPQNDSYHDFADKRMFFGIPNFLDVTSNIGFFLTGLHGLVVLLTMSTTRSSRAFQYPNEKVQYLFFFASIILVALGSAYYHLNPNTITLFWDRLPMTLSFMSLMSCILTEKISPSLGTKAILPMLIVGLVSVGYWRYSESIKLGDLRLYGVVQFVPMAITPFIFLIFSSRYSESHNTLICLSLYILAKIIEVMDWRVFEWTMGTISGHSLKHIITAVGIDFLVRMVRKRRLIKSADFTFRGL